MWTASGLVHEGIGYFIESKDLYISEGKNFYDLIFT